MKTLGKLLVMMVLSFGMLPLALRAGTGSAEAFEKLKSLAGHWETEKTNMGKATLDLEVTSNGTALLEKSRVEENGKPIEMITLYYLDGGDLKLTHYCMVGNQPTMRGTYSPETKTITFDMVSISNLKNPGDGHMHHAVYTFIDNDHFQTTWTFEKDQKDAYTENVTYVRVK